MRFLFLLLLALSSSGAVARVAGPVRYRLAPELTAGAVTALKVEISFRADRSGSTGFGWEDGWQGERSLWQWARDFHVAGARTVAKTADGHWRIEASPGAELTITYRIVSAYDHDPTVEDGEQPRPIVRPGWFYAAGNAVFARPDGSDDAPASFAWSGAPKGFGFASDLEHLAGPHRKARRPGTVADVIESIVIGGRDLRLFPAGDGSGIRVATLGRYAFTPEQLNRLARQVIGVERDFWHSDRRAPFLVTAAPLAGSPTQMGFSGTGRGDAFALWIDPRTPLDRVTWLLAHEYFHSWNPARLGATPADRDARTALFWFSEGFTDYYARALLVRSGLISPAEFAALWNERLRAYAGSPVRNLSGAEAAAQFWNNDAAQELPYLRGAMLAAIWNEELRARSGGESGLDALMHAQRDAARSSKEDPVTLFRTLAAQAGLDIAPDVARYLTRGETIALPAGTFGRCATIVTERRPGFSRGFDPDATAKAGNVATGVDPASPAYAAGLRDGMKILARTTGEAGNALVPYALLVDDHGRQRTIRYLPQARETINVQQIRLIAAGPECRRSLGGAALDPLRA
jgi:predicted metalloprotease with PDZ domain